MGQSDQENGYQVLGLYSERAVAGSRSGLSSMQASGPTVYNSTACPGLGACQGRTSQSILHLIFHKTHEGLGRRRERCHGAVEKAQGPRNCRLPYA